MLELRLPPPSTTNTIARHHRQRRAQSHATSAQSHNKNTTQQQHNAHRLHRRPGQEEPVRGRERLAAVRVRHLDLPRAQGLRDLPRRERVHAVGHAEPLGDALGAGEGQRRRCGWGGLGTDVGFSLDEAGGRGEKRREAPSEKREREQTSSRLSPETRESKSSRA